jgi:catechol 2,3-dioxygenase-like lactoylglutathione lyase family enzyme
VRLRFIYAPVADLPSGIAFYRDTLGLSESWREGESTVAFAIPDAGVDIMVTNEVPGEPPGPMYQVPVLADYLAARPDFVVRVEQRDIPDGAVIGIEDPAGNVVYFFDQKQG